MSAIRNFWGKILPHVPHIIRHDFWRKLFALVFACLLTGYAYQNVKSQMELVKIDVRGVPVRFVAIEEGVTLIPRDVSADISVEVPKEQKSLKNTDFYLECPVTRYQVETDMPVELRQDMVRSNVVLEELRVLSVNPNMLPLNIDIMDTKDVPVHPVSDSAEVMEGYQASLVQPEKPVTIRGPKKLLDTIEYLETEKIPLANVTKSFSRQVDLVSPYDKNIEILSGKVKVEVKVAKNKPREQPHHFEDPARIRDRPRRQRAGYFPDADPSVPRPVGRNAARRLYRRYQMLVRQRPHQGGRGDPRPGYRDAGTRRLARLEIEPFFNRI